MLIIGIRCNTRSLKPMLTRPYTVLLLLLLAVQTAAAGAPGGRLQRLNQIMESYGLNMIIQHIPQDVLDDIRKGDYLDRQQLSKDQIKTIEQAVSTNLKAARIRKDVLKQLQSHYDPARIDSVLTELRRPLYRKITALEKQANSPEAGSDFQEFVARLALHNPDPKRLRLMKELDRASRSSEIAVSVEVEIAKTLMRCAAAYNPDDQSLSERRLDRIAGRLRRTITPSVQNHIVIWSLYAYRTLSSRQLKAYISLYRNEDIQWFTRLSSEALIKALDRASTRSARDVARLRNALHI